jgi:alpha-ketoglutarate-dependent taurine dioxygenase
MQQGNGQRLTHRIKDQRAWTAATLDEPSAWYYPLPAVARGALERLVEQVRGQAGPATELALEAADEAMLAKVLEPVRTALETGRGFAILTDLGVDTLNLAQAQAVYWALGRAVGQPFAQNVQGTLLYDVRDTGQSVAQGARFSVTNAESSFHTDNSFGTDVLDYVGLLCLQTARSGGHNQVISAYTVHNELLANHPDSLELLYQPFHVDRRGGVKPGEAPTVLQPILTYDGRELTARYLRYWIEVGHQKAEQPLSEHQVRALDLLDQTLARKDLFAEFGLRQGDVWFINNRWVLHNRTAFEDHTELDRRRHLVRLWLKSKVAGEPIHAG